MRLVNTERNRSKFSDASNVPWVGHATRMSRVMWNFFSRRTLANSASCVRSCSSA